MHDGIESHQETRHKGHACALAAAFAEHHGIGEGSRFSRKAFQMIAPR
jgi:hypothetical protein